jgi:hypothetical protein
MQKQKIHQPAVDSPEACGLEFRNSSTDRYGGELPFMPLRSCVRFRFVNSFQVVLLWSIAAFPDLPLFLT